MAADNELQIVLTLIDEASEKLNKALGNVKKETNEVEKETEKASKSININWAKVALVMLGARSALVLLKNQMKDVIDMAGDISPAFKLSMFEAGQAIDDVKLKVAKGLIPAIVGFINGLKQHLQILSDPQKYYDEHVLGIKSMGAEAQRTSKDIKKMSDALTYLNNQFLIGAITAQQYYGILTSGSAANFQNMQLQMNLTRDMAAQENLMNNQSLMDYSTNVQAKMGLLKTLQQYHHTMYSTMMDFANMTIQKVSTGLGTTISSIIMGTKKASEAWKEFGQSLITSIIEFVVQYGIQMLIAAALSKVILASTILQANAITAAWLPAAIYASIATLGAADAAGAAGFATGTAAMLGTAAAVKLGTVTVTGGNGYAEGGWAGLNGPEVALLGERGPEYVVPNNRLGNMGNQTSIHIEVNNPVVRSDEDIDKLTEEISSRLAREAERL